MMKFILVCLCVLAFSESIESKNKELRKTNQVLLKTLRELAVGEEALATEPEEKAVGVIDETFLCYKRCRRRGRGFTECCDHCSIDGCEDDTERAVGNSQCDLINDDNKSYKCNSYYKNIVKCDICQDDNAGAVDNSAINDAIRNPNVDESAVGFSCFDDDTSLRRLTGQSCASFSIYGCGLPLQANYHIWLVREICPRSCGMCSDKETVQEEQVGDDGGCYNRCRATGASMNECASDCPMPGETVVEHDDSTEEEVGRTNPWPCRDTNKVGHNRSMKPGQGCDTRWGHLTYWNARHEYCKNDKGNWGCQYGYKRVGWWNDYCCNKWESLNTNDCKCR